MQMNEQVLTALEVLKNFAENDFEKHRIDVLISDLTAPPKVEIIDDVYQTTPKIRDLTGMTFGRLTVLEHAENDKHGNAQWQCRCCCGKVAVVSGNRLISGVVKSCGCLKNEGNNKKHGMSNTKTHHRWTEIKQRCFNPNNKAYPDYGGRGITMYAAWIHDFQAFYDYVSQLEHFNELGYSLDRINVNGNYEPGNLRWATRTEQNRNKRNTLKVNYNGEEMTLAQAAEKSGINVKTLYDRLKNGYDNLHLFSPVKTVWT